jgi:hypothetical protein
LSQVLGMDFSMDITPGRLELRTAAGLHNQTWSLHAARP